MMINNRKQFTEYLVREVARRVVPIALEETGDDECLRRSRMLRKLADDASMTEVKEVCDAACEAANAAVENGTTASYYAWASAGHTSVAAAAANRDSYDDAHTYAAYAAADIAFVTASEEYTTIYHEAHEASQTDA